MTEIRDRTYGEGEIVETDGNTFLRCTFSSSSLRYAGGELPLFQECTFENMGWLFADAALRTIQLLQSLNNSGVADGLIADLFKAGNYITD